MKIEIYKLSGSTWHWRAYTDKGRAICKCQNANDAYGYTEYSTATRSAQRFIDNYIDSQIKVEISYEGKIIGGQNLG